MKEMPDLSPARVQESNLTRMVLFLKRMDIADMGQCDFIERPGNVQQISEIMQFLKGH